MRSLPIWSGTDRGRGIAGRRTASARPLHRSCRRVRMIESRSTSKCRRGLLRFRSMSESQPCGPDSLDARLAALANAAAILDWPLPRERDESTCCDLARVIDALLVRVARGRGALDVALGEALDVLATGSRVVRVGYSGSG